MKIQNRKIQKLLQDKKKLVDEGRKINKKLEKKAEKFVSTILYKMGLQDAGVETVDVDGEKVENKLFSGSYQKLKEVFSTESMIDINEQVEHEFEEDISALKVLEGKINKINEQVSVVLRKEVSLDLPEFHQVRRIELVGNDTMLEVVDLIDEYKQKLLKLNEDSTDK